MKYIPCQHVAGDMRGMVHILATQLGMPLSCITPAQNDVKGRRRGGGLSWMTLCET